MAIRNYKKPSDKKKLLRNQDRLTRPPRLERVVKEEKKQSKEKLTTPVSKFKLRTARGLSGKGIFAVEEIPKGKRIIEYIGKNVPVEKQKTATGRYLFETGRKKMIDGNIKENIARFINHSCRPNCEADGPSGKVYIYSLKKIKTGEELTYDYGDEYFEDYIKSKGCKCQKCKNLK